MEQEELINRINCMQAKKITLNNEGGNLACIQEEVYEDRNVPNNSSMLVASND